jgi:hypothetical protein
VKCLIWQCILNYCILILLEPPPQSIHTEWQWCDFWRTVHSVMMEKLALAGEGGGARPLLSMYEYITNKFAVYSTLPVFHLFLYMYSVAATATVFVRSEPEIVQQHQNKIFITKQFEQNLTHPVRLFNTYFTHFTNLASSKTKDV